MGTPRTGTTRQAWGETLAVCEKGHVNRELSLEDTVDRRWTDSIRHFLVVVHMSTVSTEIPWEA